VSTNGTNDGLQPVSFSTLAVCVAEARQRTLYLGPDLRDDQFLDSRLAIVNSQIWEIGHRVRSDEWQRRKVQTDFRVWEVLS